MRALVKKLMAHFTASKLHLTIWVVVASRDMMRFHFTKLERLCSTSLRYLIFTGPLSQPKNLKVLSRHSSMVSTAACYQGGPRSKSRQFHKKLEEG